jgi:hypothetical protein
MIAVTVTEPPVIAAMPAGQHHSRVGWRKRLLRRRWELSFIAESFERLWGQHFPQHDLTTLRLNRPAAEAYWISASWTQAARWYHDNRNGRTLMVEPSSKRELNGQLSRYTPQATIEAIWFCVRERGLDALNEPINKQRLASCDAAARAELTRRIQCRGGHK